ncbi:MAG: multiprotein-bridging factor 1 family protein [Sphingomonadales bacterium]
MSTTPLSDLSNLSTDDVAELLGVERADVELADATIALVERYAGAITRMRDQRGLSRADLARLLGLSPGRVTQLESGEIRHAVNLKTLAEIAHKLDFDLDITLHDRRDALADDQLVAADVDEALGVPLVSVPLGVATVAQVACMNEAQAALFTWRLARKITEAHPEAADETFVLQAAALVEEEEGSASLANG